MKVELIAATAVKPAMFEIMPDIGGPSTDGEKLVTFAGRACYQSFHRPNAATSRDRDYIRSAAIEKDHGSILEHASASFYITGVSRSLTHELIRHRAGTAYSELSQRYVDMADVDLIEPPLLRDFMAGSHQDWKDSFAGTTGWYRNIVQYLRERGVPNKLAREAARAVMPNATETKIVMTANYRAWRHIIAMRGSEHADAEIRELAIEILEQLYDEAPSVFGDFSIVTLADGRQVIE